MGRLLLLPICYRCGEKEDLGICDTCGDLICVLCSTIYDFEYHAEREEWLGPKCLDCL